MKTMPHTGHTYMYALMPAEGMMMMVMCMRGAIS